MTKFDEVAIVPGSCFCACRLTITLPWHSGDANEVLLPVPESAVEAGRQGHDIGEGVSGGLIVGIILVLNWVEGSAHIKDGVGVVLQNCLAVVEICVRGTTWERLHLICVGGRGQLGGQQRRGHTSSDASAQERSPGFRAEEIWYFLLT